MKIVSGLFFLLLSSYFAYGQSKTIAQLKEEEKTHRGFYFYPSTLRMINLQDDQDFNDLVKDIRKIIFFRMKKDAFFESDFYNTIKQLQREENYKEYIILEGPELNWYVVGKKSPDQVVIFGATPEEHYIIEILGTLDLRRIPGLYREFQSGENNLGEGFLDIFSLMGINNGKKRNNTGETEENSEQNQ